MTAHRNKTLLALATLASFGSAPALAQDSSSYYYLGGAVGQSRAKIDEEGITARQIGPGLVGTVMTRDERDTGYRVFLGRQFNRYIAVEAGFFKLGQFSFQSSTVPAGTLDGQLRSQGGNLDLIGGLPLSENLTAIARVGVQYAKTRDRFSGTGAVHVIDPTPSKRAANAKVGLGLEYAVSPSFSVRAEAERYRMDDASGSSGSHVNMVSVSLLFPFGRAPSSRRVSAAPSYVAPAPAPAPVVMAAPVAAPMAAPVVVAVAAPAPAPMVQRRRVSFSAESLFGFDRAEVRAEGKTALDGFSRELAGSQFDLITVEGHTDRLGSVAYNQRLSVERAESVKAYLVNEGRLDGSKITAVGKSESRPVTKAADCKGQHATPALIACLQPDRRVDVEVNATR